MRKLKLGSAIFWILISAIVAAASLSALAYSQTTSSVTNLVAIPVSATQVDLSWGGPSISTTSPTGYAVQRSANEGATWSTVVTTTNSSTETFRDSGLLPSTTYYYRVSAQTGTGTSVPSNIAFATTGSNPQQFSVSKVKAGLLVLDSFSNETRTQQQLQSGSKYWLFGGDAPGKNATYTFWRDFTGLHIGVKARSNNTYVGFYAVSRNTNATLFHVTIITPLQSLPATNAYFEPGMYIQTNGTANSNYVSCNSSTSSFGTTWGIFSDISQVFNLLWSDNSDTQPLRRDCTIVTNGANYLKAYLDGNLVYDKANLDLNMTRPFVAFMEPTSSYEGQLLNATYTNYYATDGENVTIENIPPNVTSVDLINNTGGIIDKAQPVGQGVVLDIGRFVFPLNATIGLYNSSNALIASSPETLYGGDEYSVSGTPSLVPSVPLNLSATAVSSSQINLSWSPPARDGGFPVTGYRIERTMINCATWTVVASDTNSTSTNYSDIGLNANTVYTYRVYAINSAGQGPPSNTASSITSSSDTSLASRLDGNITGIYYPLYDLGELPQLLVAKKLYPNVPFNVNINPDSGPGDVVSPAWTGAITLLRENGAIVTGYVPTGYGGDSIQDVEGKVLAYSRLYPGLLDGIMFDEVSASCSDYGFYKEITDYARSIGYSYIRANPGDAICQSLVPLFNHIAIYESQGYPNETALSANTFYPQYTKSSVGFGATIVGEPTYDPKWLAMATKYLKWVYITDQTEPNPYAVFPSYFNQYLSDLSKLAVKGE